jgi:hypothetical protein
LAGRLPLDSSEWVDLGVRTRHGESADCFALWIQRGFGSVEAGAEWCRCATKTPYQARHLDSRLGDFNLRFAYPLKSERCLEPVKYANVLLSGCYHLDA